MKNGEESSITISDLAVFCKKKGFVFQNSELYNGLSGFWDFGPLGVELFNNIKASWWKRFVQSRSDVVGMDGSIISHGRVWKASGHIESFSDISVKCSKCGKINKIDKSELGKAKCEFCGGSLDESTAKEVKLLFPVSVGSEGTIAYLRGETAQEMFINFKMIAETMRMKLPFGIAQVGRCFRNEIAPRDFLFRCREFHIAEFEYFINPRSDKCSIMDAEHLNLRVMLLDANTQEQGSKEMREVTISQMVSEGILDEWHAYWLAEQFLWYLSLGLSWDRLRVREHVKSELAHYSTATFDIDYKFPFGFKEISGIANRGQYDLTRHMKESGKSLEYFDEETRENIVPRVIEPSFGMERAFLAVLSEAYSYDKERENVVLKIIPELAPVKVAVLPLLSNRPELLKLALQVYDKLRKRFVCTYDKSGSIGRRYARQDEIGTPFCVTIDFESVSNGDVTVRDRDTTRQVRVGISELEDVLSALISGSKSFEELAQKK
ncbi:MAG: glycine--tRNA ligase [Candidatus Woesearchaeota archaeon]